MRKLTLLGISIFVCVRNSYAGQDQSGHDFFRSNSVPRIQMEISSDAMETLRKRVDVQATIREGGTIYTNVAVHLKGSDTFEPVDGKPSLTLHFDKFVPDQRFHGLAEFHLNNSVEDPTYLCEQFGREVFAIVGVPSPRAGHALVSLNGRDLGLFVVIEGASKQFLKHFKSTKGNLYDGASGGDVTEALKADCGDAPENRSDLTNLVNAAREPDPAKRLARLEQVLDVEEFILFAATEAFIVHWDGYSIGGSNYLLFHDF